MASHTDLMSGLMGAVQRITDYPIIWPRQGGASPEDEHIVATILQNNNQGVVVSDPCLRRGLGFLDLRLVSEVGGHEIVTQSKAEQIAALFPINSEFQHNGIGVGRFTNVSIRSGEQIRERWETLIRVEYVGYFTMS